MSKGQDHTIKLRSGEVLPSLGQGTWRLGESLHRWSEEVAAVRLGIDLGMTVIDTAEMYGDGAAEKLVGEAVAGRRDEVFLVSKVLPANASRHRAIVACEHSLGRLRTDHLDLYLLHWRGRYPLEETHDAFAQLVQEGKIRYWGVSNFDVPDMQELMRIPGSEAVATNQVLYNLEHRGIEYELLPWCRGQGIPIMAYSPLGQGELTRHPVVIALAKQHKATAAQIALSWVLQQDGVMAIPRSGSVSHVRENAGALHVELTRSDLTRLDAVFRPPNGPQTLEVI